MAFIVYLLWNYKSYDGDKNMPKIAEIFILIEWKILNMHWYNITEILFFLNMKKNTQYNIFKLVFYGLWRS